MPKTKSFRAVSIQRTVSLIAMLFLGFTAIVGSGGGGGDGGGGGTPPPPAPSPPPPPPPPPANMVPVANDFAQTMDNIGRSLNIDVTTIPGNSLGDPPAVVAAIGAMNGILVTGGTVVQYTPLTGFVGVETITYSITDTDGEAASGTITITVNAPPSANNFKRTTADDTPTDIDVAQIAGNSLGNRPSTITTTKPANGTASVAGNVITYKSNPDFAGDDPFMYTITDADGEEATGTLTASVLDGTAPTTSITFPTPVSATDENRLTVTGVAADNSDTVTSVSVNGVTATSSDGFATWRADDIPLTPGTNRLLVSVTDAVGNTDTAAAEAVVTYENVAAPHAENGVFIDSANNRALVSDHARNTLLAIDLDNGDRSIVSGSLPDGTVRGTGPKFDGPEDIAILANGNAIVGNFNSGDIYEVDLNNGNRTELSGGSRGTGDLVGQANGFALDVDTLTGQEQIWLIDSLNGVLFHIDLLSGNRKVVSGSYQGNPDPAGANAGPSFIVPHDVAMDEGFFGTKVLYVTDRGNHTVMGVTLEGMNVGDRQTISGPADGTGDLLVDPWGIDIDSANNRLLVSQFNADDRVVAVAFGNGDRTTLSPAVDPTAADYTGLDIPGHSYIAMDAAKDRLIVPRQSGPSGVVVAVALGDGVRTSFSAPHGIGTSFAASTDLFFDATNDRILSVSSDGSIIAIDLRQSNRTTLSGATIPDAENAILQAADISFDALFTTALDRDDNSVKVTDGELGRVISIDIDTGVGETFSGGVVGVGDAFLSPSGIVIDRANGRALVTDQAAGALVSVDVATGNRTTLTSNDDTVGEGPPMIAPLGVTMGGSSNTAFVATAGNAGLTAVELVSGDRVRVSE